VTPADARKTLELAAQLLDEGYRATGYRPGVLGFPGRPVKAVPGDVWLALAGMQIGASKVGHPFEYPAP
jgi:hypothetical protein